MRDFFSGQQQSNDANDSNNHYQMDAENFSSSKIRMTMQRLVILQELRKMTTHPTADEIYHVLRRRLPKISLATVYRNLEVLSTLGLIQKLELAGQQKRFDGNIGNHYHFRCTSCGKVTDVTIAPLAAIDNLIAGIKDYEVEKYRLELLGLCPECKTAKG